MSIVLSPHNSVESTGNTSNDIIGGSTTLNGSISDSTTTLIVTSTIQFPTNGTIDIEGEYIIYTGTTSTTFTGCIRGSFNSVAVTHSDTTSLKGIFIGASEFNSLPSILVTVKTDKDSKKYHEYSSNNISWDSFPIEGYNINANEYTSQTAVKGKRYFRIRCENNSGVIMNTFELNTYYGVFVPDIFTFLGRLSANSGVDIGDVDVTSILPGTASTNLGKAVDSVAGETDTGVALLAVRDDTLSSLTPVDGDYTQLRVNSTGALHVTGAG
jgi:hypothetical protein